MKGAVRAGTSPFFVEVELGIAEFELVVAPMTVLVPLF
jgi:hypothetical protein